jgi:hypothetical protein
VSFPLERIDRVGGGKNVEPKHCSNVAKEKFTSPISLQSYPFWLLSYILILWVGGSKQGLSGGWSRYESSGRSNRNSMSRETSRLSVSVNRTFSDFLFALR